MPGEKARVRIAKNDRMRSIGEMLEMLTYNLDLRDSVNTLGPVLAVNIRHLFFSFNFFPSVDLYLTYCRCCLRRLSWI